MPKNYEPSLADRIWGIDCRWGPKDRGRFNDMRHKRKFTVMIDPLPADILESIEHKYRFTPECRQRDEVFALIVQTIRKLKVDNPAFAATNVTVMPSTKLPPIWSPNGC